MPYIRYEDPGHSWLRVPKSELEALGIAAQISPYSFQSGTYAYLEEDCDMARFIDALEAHRGTKWDWNTDEVVRFTNGRSHVTRYHQYEPPVATS